MPVRSYELTGIVGILIVSKYMEVIMLTVESLKDLLANWIFKFTFGKNADVYACGNKRKMIDRATGKVITEYTI